MSTEFTSPPKSRMYQRIHEQWTALFAYRLYTFGHTVSAIALPHVISYEVLTEMSLDALSHPAATLFKVRVRTDAEELDESIAILNESLARPQRDKEGLQFQHIPYYEVLHKATLEAANEHDEIYKRHEASYVNACLKIGDLPGRDHTINERNVSEDVIRYEHKQFLLKIKATTLMLKEHTDTVGRITKQIMQQ